MRVLPISFVFGFFVSFLAVSQKISKYEKFTGVYTQESKEYIVLRTFLEEGKSKYLVVNPQDLSTRIITAKTIEVISLTFDQIKAKFDSTPYLKGIRFAEENSKLLQDAGLTHGIPHERGIVLTIDLCPSKKNLDRRIFNSIIQEFQKIETPVPIAVSVSGLWMKNHQNDLAWLKMLVSKGEIKVDWVNHTYHHPYSPSSEIPLQRNFMLERGVNIKEEILENEVAMLQKGLVPSVFFRFPGLVSDDSVFQNVLSYGLIPIGSDAWLAKGQKPTGGSYVLIHGNGNEPLGVKKFIELMKQEDASIRNKTWLIQDIRDSVE